MQVVEGRCTDIAERSRPPRIVGSIFTLALALGQTDIPENIDEIHGSSPLQRDRREPDPADLVHEDAFHRNRERRVAFARCLDVVVDARTHPIEGVGYAVIFELNALL